MGAAGIESATSASELDRARNRGKHLGRNACKLRSRLPVDLASFRLFPERTCQRLAKEVRASRRAKVLLGGRDRYQTELLQHEKPVEHQMERCVFALAEAKHLDVADLD